MRHSNLMKDIFNKKKYDKSERNKMMRNMQQQKSILYEYVADVLTKGEKLKRYMFKEASFLRRDRLSG